MSPPPRWLTNSARLLRAADQLRPAAAAGRRRPPRAPRVPIGHEPLLGALAARAQHAVSRSTSPTLEADRLGRAQPAGVHQLQQRAVAQRGRLGAAGRVEQLRDLAAGQHLRELLATRAGARRSAVGSRVDELLAAQVAVEGAQARGLALERRGRDRGRPSPPAASSERKSARSPCWAVERVGAGLAQERAELHQVRAVGLERVARQPALELEVGEEVEHQVLDSGAASGAAIAMEELNSPPRRGRLAVQRACQTWVDVDRYIADTLIGDDPAVDHGDLPLAEVSHRSGALELLARLAGARRDPRDRDARGLLDDWLARALPPAVAS